MAFMTLIDLRELIKLIAIIELKASGRLINNDYWFTPGKVITCIITFMK